MKTCFFVLVAIIVIFFSTSGVAQDFSAFGILSLPVGAFGSDDLAGNDDSGFAEIGYGVGIEFDFPFYEMINPGLPLFVQARLIFNPVNRDKLKESLADITAAELWNISNGRLELTSFKFDMGQYTNLSLLGGTKHEISVTSGVKIIGKGLLGLNVFRNPRMEYWMTVYDNVDTEYFNAFVESDSELWYSLCFAVGIGAKIRDRLEIGFEYLNMGKPSGDHYVKVTAIDGSSIIIEPFEAKQPVSMMGLTVGLRF